MRNALWLVVLGFLIASGCASSCGGGDGHVEGSSFPKSEASGSSTAQSETQRPPSDAQPVKWQAFKPLVPDTIESYHADGEATGRAFGLPSDSELSTLSRKYTSGDSKLEIEMHDAVQAAGTLELFDQASQVQRETAQSVMRAGTVQNHKALVQWSKATSTARISVIVAERFVVNVIQRPATSPEAALALANKLDLAPLEKLGAQP